MKLVLALDTSTRTGTVALGRMAGAPDPIAATTLEVSATHSETVLPAIDRLLRDVDAMPEDVAAVVVGSGPGSFTGVRIGAALARGLCYGGRCELHAFSSLSAVAVASGQTGEICALVDARRGQVYAAGYAITAEAVVERFPPRAGSLADLLETLDVGSWRFAAALPDAGRARIESAGGALAPPDTARPTAEALLRLRALDPEGGRVSDPAHWEPAYVRGSSAERRVGRD